MGAGRLGRQRDTAEGRFRHRVVDQPGGALPSAADAPGEAIHIADSVVLTAVNTGIVSPDDFVTAGPAVALAPAGRKKFIQAFESRLDSEIMHPIFGYRISYRRVLEVQLRLLGRALTGEIAAYPAFTTR